jgi:hypothetical protein
MLSARSAIHESFNMGPHPNAKNLGAPHAFHIGREHR